MSPLAQWASKIAPNSSLPAPVSLDAHLEGFRACQRLALRAAKEIGTLLREGWTEARAAELFETYLRDHGVKTFFHHPFVWFGERTRFDGVRNYAQYSPGKRVLLPDEVVILDVAPILDGYICDIGYTMAYGDVPQYDKARKFLKKLRSEIPGLFSGDRKGSEIWNRLDSEIQDAGFDNIHKKYPFGVLGHRVHSGVKHPLSVRFLNFGWQSYWALLSRGLFGQLLNKDFEGPLKGLWAIEPHIGTPHFGAKFEEILVVTDGGARWLDSQSQSIG